MPNVHEQLKTLGFAPAGVVVPDALSLLRVVIERPVTGYAVYAMVVGDEIKKFGTTGRKNSTFKQRMHSTFSALRCVIQGGAPFTGDPFKRNAPTAVIQGKEIELWVHESTQEAFEELESALNNQFRPEWTKEGAAHFAA